MLRMAVPDGIIFGGYVDDTAVIIVATDFDTTQIETKIGIKH